MGEPSATTNQQLILISQQIAAVKTLSEGILASVNMLVNAIPDTSLGPGDIQIDIERVPEGYKLFLAAGTGEQTTTIHTRYETLESWLIATLRGRLGI